jgi:hypothetical protein
MRIISWFSCGAASAVATKLAIEESDTPVQVVYCEVVEEHPDNMRFLKDCEEWFGQEVLILGNDKYNRSIYEVFEKTRFLKGPSGARCTGELKKKVRYEFQESGDVLVFGYTVDEQKRADRIIKENFDTELWIILIDKGITHADCLGIIATAGIELPELYKMGYHHNNCVGCVKGEAGYWNKVRKDFPEVFERMSQMEQKLGRTVCKKEWREDGKVKRIRIPLSELPEDLGVYKEEKTIECGILCSEVSEGLDD